MRVLLFAPLPLVALAVAVAYDKPLPPLDKTSINEIMVQAHLKPQNRGTKNNLDNKLLDGKGTDNQKMRLLALYSQLGARTPRRGGDAEDWTTRTTELVAATTALIAGEEKAAERFARARDCKGCHAAHR